MMKRLGLCGWVLCAVACGDDGSGASGETEAGSGSASTAMSASISTSATETNPSASGTPTAPQGDGSATGDSSSTGDTGLPGDFPPLDILLILDDTRDMHHSDAWLDDGLDDLGHTLTDLGIDFRFASIDTTVPHPWCPDATPDHAGAFEARSCRERLDEFVPSTGENYHFLCESLCPYPTLDLDNPWVTPADDPGGDELGVEGYRIGRAMACLGKQGYAGCGFEQPLEAMYQSVQRMRDPNAPEFGFVRPEANLLIIFDTSEADCSFADPSIFDPKGSRTFWSDPQAPAPGSSVCWNAGVACEGDASGFSACNPANKDTLGEDASAADAVLHPMERYTSIIDELRAEKAQHGTDVYVRGVLGVDIKDADATPYRLDGVHAEFEATYGIGPGCLFHNPSRATGAVPPVRLRELIETTAESSWSAASICGFQQPFAYWANELLGID